MTTESDVVDFEVVTTLEDQLALQRYLTATMRRKGASLPGATKPAWRKRGVFRFWPMFITFFGLTFIGVVTNDQSSVFLESIFKVSSGWKLAVQIALIVVMFWLLPGIALRWWTRRATRTAHAELYARRPDVAPGDPTMAVRRHIRFDDAGFNVRTPVIDHWESWRRVSGLDETPDLLVLRVGKSIGYAFPKRDLSPELQERLHLFVVQRCASQWPF